MKCFLKKDFKKANKESGRPIMEFCSSLDEG